MTDQGTQEWIEARKSGIGGSEASALYGVGYSTQWTMWASKTGRRRGGSSRSIKPGQDQRLYWGNAHEPAVRTAYAELTGREVTDGVTMLRHPTVPCMIANTDGAIPEADGYEGPGVWECKTAEGFKRSEWYAEDGHPSAPLAYQVQAQHYMACTGSKWASFAVLFGGNRLDWFDFHRNDGFIASLEARCAAFWRDHVEADVPPPVDDSQKTADAMRDIFNDRGGIVRLPDGFKFLRDWWAMADAQRKTSKTECQRLANLVRATMGNASVGVCYDGTGFTVSKDGTILRVGEASISAKLRGLPAPELALVQGDVAVQLEAIEAMMTGRNISQVPGVE